MRGSFCFLPPLLALPWLVLTSAVTLGSDRQTSAKLPVPEPAAVQEAFNLLREVYGDEYDQAKTSFQKTAFAKKLLDQAAKTTGAPVDRFVLLKVAQDFSARAADAATAVEAVDMMAEAFEIDRLEAKLNLLATVAQTARSSTQRKALAKSAADLIDEAVARDDYDVAAQLARIALAAARRARDGALIRQITDRNKRLEKSKKAYAALRQALETLEKSPIDPDANQAVGSYFCLEKGDWEKGIPMLALGTDPALRALAQKELKGVSSADEQISLGDGWWDLAQKEKGPVQRRLQLRAGDWYKQANSRLRGGLAKIKVERRLEAIAKVPRPAGDRSRARRRSTGALVAPEVKLRVVCDALAARASPKGLAFDAVAFTGPRGDGRRGANGFLVPAHTEWQSRGTVWSCEFRRGGSARGIQFIHPFRNGHVIVTALNNRLVVTSPGTWPKFGYTIRGPTLPLVTSANFPQVFQLREQPHRLMSVLLPNGVFRFYLDGQLVATGAVPDARPLLLAPNFKGPKPLPQAPPGFGGVIIGPRDNGVNEAKNVSFGST